MIQTLDAEAQSLPERLAILDPSFHPVLSFPHDIPLNAQFEAILKSNKIQPTLAPRQRPALPDGAAAPTAASNLSGESATAGVAPATFSDSGALPASLDALPSSPKFPPSASKTGAGHVTSQERKKEKALARKKARLAAAAALAATAETEVNAVNESDAEVEGNEAKLDSEDNSRG